MNRWKEFCGRFPLELVALWVVAILTRMVNLTYPKSTVFDEVYFKQDAAYYFNHHYYFDVHPPLGKLLFAAWAKLCGISPATMTNPPATDLRIWAAIAGVAVVPLTYGIVRCLSRSRVSAGLAGCIVALDTALIVESRFVLMDNMLLAFGLGAVYATLRWRSRPGWIWLIATGLLIGAAASIKWTGLAPDVVALAILAVTARHMHYTIGRMAIRFVVVISLALAVYVSCFAIHFALLTQAGPGDAFMSQQFQSTLVGDSYYSPLGHMSFLAKFFELNHEMYTANKTLTATDPYSSKWYTWPLMQRPIYYWRGSVQPNGTQGNIYLIGNPFSWWFGSISVFVSGMLLAIPAYRRRLKKTARALGVLLFAYLINWLPFAGIGRVMFLYHYLFAFIFSAMLLAYLVGSVFPEFFKDRYPRQQAVVGVCVLVAAGYVYLAPLAYGWPIAPQTQAIYSRLTN